MLSVRCGNVNDGRTSNDRQMPDALIGKFLSSNPGFTRMARAIRLDRLRYG